MEKKYLILFFVGLTSCASTKYQLTSSPSEARVAAVFANGSRKDLGKTPLNLDAQEVNPNKEALTLEISKEGYEKQGVFVPGGFSHKDLSVNANLTATTLTNDTKHNEQRLNEVAAGVADIQKEIQARNYEMALTKINRMISENPQVATFYSLGGNVYYLEKRFDKALGQYRQALELNPSSAELTRVIEKLEAMNGGTK